METINRVIIFNKNTKKTLHLGTFRKVANAIRLVVEYATNNEWYIGEDDKGRIYAQPSEDCDTKRLMIWKETVCDSYAEYVQSFLIDSKDTPAMEDDSDEKTE